MLIEQRERERERERELEREKIFERERRKEGEGEEIHTREHTNTLHNHIMINTAKGVENADKLKMMFAFFRNLGTRPPS